MDIKKTIDEVVKKVTGDKALQDKFMKDPAGAIKDVTGMDIPKDQLDGVVSAVKTKLSANKAGKMLGGILGK